MHCLFTVLVELKSVFDKSEIMQKDVLSFELDLSFTIL